MSETPNLGIKLINATEDIPTMDWALSVSGEDEGSMAQKVDRAIGKLSAREIYSSEQPEGQVSGDVWHQIVSVSE